MTLSKLFEVLETINRDPYVRMNGSHIGCSGGGELEISLSSQPDKHLHHWLLSRKFISNNPGEYIYRP